MPEYRCDPLTGQTVLIAEERASRPHQFDIENTGSPDSGSEPQRSRSPHSQCPFCEGSEAMTPGELAAYRSDGSPSDTTGWQVRVFLNKYPAVCRDDERFPDVLSFQRYFSGTADSNTVRLPQAIEGVGHHEVIVETPRHILSVSEMNDIEAENMFRIYRDRPAALRQENRWAFVQIFKNVGAAAGASIPHSHSQLIAMPFIPYPFSVMLKNAAAYRNKTQQCYWCSMLESELSGQKRLIEETEHFAALCPFASRFAGEIKIYPKEHQSNFDEILTTPAPPKEGNVIAEFASLVKRTVCRLEKAAAQISGSGEHSNFEHSNFEYGNLAYNFVLHTSPFVMPPEYDDNGKTKLFHWSLSILPSLARAAGFEWGTGLHINPVPPEIAAERMKNISI